MESAEGYSGAHRPRYPIQKMLDDGDYFSLSACLVSLYFICRLLASMPFAKKSYKIFVHIPVRKVRNAFRLRWHRRFEKKLKRRAKVAVVGAGIGGSSAAYFLKREFGNSVELHVYEAGHEPGGRCKCIQFGRDPELPKSKSSSRVNDVEPSLAKIASGKHEGEGRPQNSKCQPSTDIGPRASEKGGRFCFETGASIISEMNLYFREFMDLGEFDPIVREMSLPMVILGKDKNHVLAADTSVPDTLGELTLHLLARVSESDPESGIPGFARFIAGLLSGLLGVVPGFRSFVRLSFPRRLHISDILTTIRTVRKYGFWQLKKLKGLVKKRKVLEFSNLYKALDAGEAFPNVEKLIEKTGVQQRRNCAPCGNSSGSEADITPSILLETSAWDTIKSIEKDLSDDIMNDLVDPNMRCNYGGQGLHTLHGFVGMVSVAGGIGSRCFAVKGGNRYVIKNLLENHTIPGGVGLERVSPKTENRQPSEECGSSDRLYLRTRVAKVKKCTGNVHAKTASDGKYTLHLSQAAHDREGWHVVDKSWQEEGFDVVIYANALINRDTAKEEASGVTEGVLGANSRDSSTACRDVQTPSPLDAPVFEPEVLPENLRSKYRRCVCTLVQGEVNQNYFIDRLKSKGDFHDTGTGLRDFSRSWTTTKNPEAVPFLAAYSRGDADAVPFYSISMLFPCNISKVTGESPNGHERYIESAIESKAAVYKIFSKAKLTQKQLEEIFLSYRTMDSPEIHIDDWLAYPQYSVPQALDGNPSGNFVLSQSGSCCLLYVNPIELAAGAMEMSAISGKNCANLASHWLRENVGLA